MKWFPVFFVLALTSCSVVHRYQGKGAASPDLAIEAFFQGIKDQDYLAIRDIVMFSPWASCHEILLAVIPPEDKSAREQWCLDHERISNPGICEDDEAYAQFWETEMKPLYQDMKWAVSQKTLFREQNSSQFNCQLLGRGIKPIVVKKVGKRWFILDLERGCFPHQDQGLSSE